MRLIKKVLAMFLIICSIYYIWSQFDWAQIVVVLRNADLQIFFVGSFITTLVFWALRALRWTLLLKTVHAWGGTFLHLYLCTACCLALSIITPAQSGEALKIEMLRKTSGLQRIEGYGCFAIERVLDLLCILQIAIVALIFGIGRGLGLSLSLLAFSFVLLCVVIVVGAWLAMRVGPWEMPIQAMLGTFIRSPARLFLAWLLSMAGWLIVVVSWGLCLASVGIWLTPIHLMFLTSAVTILNLLSFVPGGIGVAEVSTVVALSHFGLPDAEAQAGAIILRACGVVIILCGVCHYAFWRIYMRRRQYNYRCRHKKLH
jgi:uncharacterized membrane protein YbhN (UPF0104 family)